MDEEKLVEVVSIYPKFATSPKKAIATVHIYLIKENIDVRGCQLHYTLNDDKIFFRLPHGSQWDPDVKKKVCFPLITTMDDAKKKKWLEQSLEQIKKMLPEVAFPTYRLKKKFPPKKPFNKFGKDSKPNYRKVFEDVKKSV